MMNGMLSGEAARASTHPSSVNQSQRSGDHFLEADERQLARLGDTLRRVNDIADRLAGPAPNGAAGEAGPRDNPGFIGALVQRHMVRDLMLGRIEEALSRIEEIL